MFFDPDDYLERKPGAAESKAETARLMRAARQRWLGRFAGLLACERGSEQAPQRGSVAWLATGALALDLEDPDGGQGGATLEEMAEVAMWPRRGAAVEVPVEIDGTADGGADDWVEAERERRGAARRRRTRRIERERILAAIAESVGSNGYRATQLRDVLGPADVSPFVFYTHFSGKEECMLAAFDAAVASILEQVRPATASATGCAAKAEAALRGLTELLAARETTARLVTVEVRAVGAKGEERLEEALGGVRELIGGGAPGCET